MKTKDSDDTKEARSLHGMDGRPERTTGTEREWWEVEAAGRKYSTNSAEDVADFLATADRMWLEALVWRCYERTETIRTPVPRSSIARQPEGEPPVRSSELVMRRVVTISVSGVANNAGTQCNYITTAVCDDGSLWWLRDNDAEWRELPPIPQPHNDAPSHAEKNP